MFKHQIRVAYRDITVGNHVYYARYLDLLEIARNEAFREMSHPLLKLQEGGAIFPVIECSLRYHGMAKYDDLLEIETRLTDLRNVQFTMEYHVRCDDKNLVSATTRHACANLEGKPIRIPAGVFTELQKHLHLDADQRKT